jgi:hypothetical protein
VGRKINAEEDTTWRCGHITDAGAAVGSQTDKGRAKWDTLMSSRATLPSSDLGLDDVAVFATVSFAASGESEGAITTSPPTFPRCFS